MFQHENFGLNIENMNSISIHRLCGYNQQFIKL